MATRRHPHLLEIAAWPWLNRLSRGNGRTITLANVPDAVWDGFAAQGFDLIYVMGIWERSPLGRELALADEGLRREYDHVLPDWTVDDVTGSPYCVSGYVPDQRMGGWEGLDAARGALHQRGLQLIVDFVPNHTAFDHPWVSSHPERYVRGSAADARRRPDDFRHVSGAWVACGRDPYFPPWRDVAQLNYFNPDTRAAMIGVLREIAAHADGVRCDMAMLVLNGVFDRTWRPVLSSEWPMPAEEFWPTATRETPSLLFLAEVYWDLEWTLQQQGFDFTYDKRLLDRLHGGRAGDVLAHLRADMSFMERLARFLENHDEPRSAVQLGARLPAAATMLATLPGMRFFFDGQMDGARHRAPVQLGRWPAEPVSAPIQELYRRLLETSNGALFHDGEWALLHVSTVDDGTHPDLIAWHWRHQNRMAVVVVNLGDAVAEGYVQLTVLPPGDAWAVTDALTRAEHRWDRSKVKSHGLNVRLAAGQAQVLTVET